MNAKYRRLFITIIIILTLGLATKLILMALEDNIVYFYTPNDLIEKFGDTKNIQNKIRIGGLVLESSIKKEGEKPGKPGLVKTIKNRTDATIKAIEKMNNP